MFPVLICWTYDYDEWIKFCLNQFTNMSSYVLRQRRALQPTYNGVSNGHTLSWSWTANEEEKTGRKDRRKRKREANIIFNISFLTPGHNVVIIRTEEGEERRRKKRWQENLALLFTNADKEQVSMKKHYLPIPNAVIHMQTRTHNSSPQPPRSFSRPESWFWFSVQPNLVVIFVQSDLGSGHKSPWD